MNLWRRRTFLSPADVACPLCPALLHRLKQFRVGFTVVIFIFAGRHSAFDDFGKEPSFDREFKFVLVMHTA
jgi:hypothetical protein